MTTVGVGRKTVRPRHVGVVMDGNRRWTRLAGVANPSEGDRTGADRAEVHVSAKLWPNFDEADVDEALARYATATG